MQLKSIIAAMLFLPVWTSSLLAAECSNTEQGFDTFKQRFAAYAAQNGIGPRGLEALASTEYSPAVIRFDRIQRKAFNKDFDAFYKLRTTGLAKPARARLLQHGSVFSRVEQDFGVPKEVLVTIWGMETAFGRDTGDSDVVTSVATLTHDCRRSDFFRPHLLGALKIIDNGWLLRQELRGARHGEVGQTQFLPGNYVAFSVDYDGDGRRDLVSSIPDLLASTANFLKGHGWQAGGSYQPGSHNYAVLSSWNAAPIYQQAIAKFASSL